MAEQREIVERRRGDLHPFRGMRRRWFVRVEWKPQDLWIGAFWKRDCPWRLDVWVCILPMIPLHFGWDAAIAHGHSGRHSAAGESK